MVNLAVKSTETVKLSAAGTSDPDGDEVFYRWFVYQEAGSYDGQVRIENNTAQESHFTAPKVTSPRTIHVILEVHDDGKPGLYSYRRVTVTVKP